MFLKGEDWFPDSWKAMQKQNCTDNRTEQNGSVYSIYSLVNNQIIHSFCIRNYWFNLLDMSFSDQIEALPALLLWITRDVGPSDKGPNLVLSRLGLGIRAIFVPSKILVLWLLGHPDSLRSAFSLRIVYCEFTSLFINPTRTMFDKLLDL